MAPPVAGNGLVLSTGTAGCSAYQIDSNPRRSAVRPIKAGSMVYAGRGMDNPIRMTVRLHMAPRRSVVPSRPHGNPMGIARRSLAFAILLGPVGEAFRYQLRLCRS